MREFLTMTLLPPSATTPVRTVPVVSIRAPSRTTRDAVPVATIAAP
jgi:hypothetical protein